MIRFRHQRSRGLILTNIGWQKLQIKKQDWENESKSGVKFTLEELSEITGLAYNTVFKIIGRQKGVDKRTLVNFLMAFDLELSPKDYMPSSSFQKLGKKHSARKVDWNKLIKLPFFFGRTTELTILEKWLIKDCCRLITIFGIGGIGKTALCVKLVKEVEQQFDYVIWRSLENAPPLQELLYDLNQVLADSIQMENNVALNTGDSLRQIIEYMRSHRCLIVLDQLDNIMLGGTECGIFLKQHREYSRLIRYLGEVAHKSCLLLTTREKPPEVSFQDGENLAVRTFELGELQQQASKKILLALNIQGTETEQNKLIKMYSGHPFALKIIAQKINKTFEGQIAKFLQQNTIEIKEINEFFGQQINRISSLEREILYKSVIISKPISFLKLRQSISLSVPSQNILESLESLLRRSFITKKSNFCIVQGIIKQYIINTTKSI